MKFGKLPTLPLNIQRMNKIVLSFIIILSCITYNNAQSYNTLEDAFSLKDTLEYLTLFDEEIDDRIYQFEKLKELQLYDCSVDSIKEEILRLPNLRKLIVRNSNLGYVSKKTFKSSIVHIDLSGNKISFIDFPEDGNIEYLAISENEIELHNLKHLKSLKTLVLQGCNLVSVPKGICSLSITTLDLSNNFLQKIPKCLFKLDELEVLNLSSNKISEFPSCYDMLDNLKNLNLSRNQISDFTKSYKFKSLSKLNLRGNVGLNIENLKIQSDRGEIIIN